MFLYGSGWWIATSITFVESFVRKSAAARRPRNPSIPNVINKPQFRVEQKYQEALLGFT
jgi:hypothetical protein